jgi:hypothetical protein
MAVLILATSAPQLLVGERVYKRKRLGVVTVLPPLLHPKRATREGETAPVTGWLRGRMDPRGRARACLSTQLPIEGAEAVEEGAV